MLLLLLPLPLLIMSSRVAGGHATGNYNIPSTWNLFDSFVRSLARSLARSLYIRTNVALGDYISIPLDVVAVVHIHTYAPY